MSANLLLVEDDPLIRRSLSSRLRKSGHRLRECETVAEAGKAVMAEDFDAVLVDFRLPDGTGFDVMERVEQRQAGTPCLMLTAEWDVVLPPAMAESMPERIPDLETVMIEGCGHWTQQEKPEEFNRLLIDWLRRRFR